MKLSSISTAISALANTKAVRGADSVDTQDFSGLLLQQGQARERDIATILSTAAANTAAKEAPLGTGVHSDTSEENSAMTHASRDESLTPEEILDFLAAGATLPLITLAKGMTVDESKVDISKVRGHGSAAHDKETAVQIRIGTDPHSPLVLKEVLLGTGVHSETLNHTGDSAPKSHQMSQTLHHQASTQAVVDSRSINAQGIHPVQPDPPRQFAPILATAQQTPTATASGVGAITATANQPMDLPDPQNSSAIPAGASVFAGTSIQGQSTSLAMLAVSTPLSSPAWTTDFSRQFMALTQGNLAQPHTAELRLDPPDLGPIRITLHISDSVAQATFVSPHAVVRQAIEGALPQLQQQLAQAGLSLGQTNVSDQQQPGQQEFQQDSSQGAGNTSISLLGSNTGAQDSAPSPVPSQRRVPHSPDALVDTFA